MGNNPTLYGYVGDLNNWADVFGLRCKKVKKIGPSIPEFHRKNFTDGIVNMRQLVVMKYSTNIMVNQTD